MTGQGELARLLRDEAILWATDAEPVFHQDGQRAPWAFYSWNVTLTPRGMELAARAMLERLATFRSTQLAGHGYTAMPLLAACVLLGDGRWTGLAVRDAPKPYLARRQVDGPRDRSQPVVVIDDSISSGGSVEYAIRALENEGFEVEGAVVLVRFPYRGGVEWAYGNGYRVETVLDIWDDVGMATLEPYGPIPHARSASAPLPSGLHPAVAARRVAEIYLSTGVPPGPPARFDREYDASGGVFVSFRERAGEYRAARHGFWQLDPHEADPCQDLVSATVLTVQLAGDRISLRTLPGLKMAVTFCGPLERIKPALLDFDRYAIVVRDSTFGRKMGGALPNTEVFVSEVEQYAHARERNAQLYPNEPHHLYRHTVTKHVEPGETWLPYGVPDGADYAWAADDAVGGALTRRARQALTAALARTALDGDPLPPTLVRSPVEGAAVGLYRRGLVASAIEYGRGPLDNLVCQAARRAVAAVAPSDRHLLDAPELLALSVAVLHDEEPLGAASSEAVATKVRRGLDTVAHHVGGKTLTALPGAIPYNNWSKQGLVDRLSSDGGGGVLDGTWSTYRTAVWVDGPYDLHPVRFGFPVRRHRGPSTVGADGDRYRRLTEQLASYVARGIGPDGLPLYHLDPVTGVATRAGTSPRLVSGLDALARAGRLLGRAEWVSLAHDGLTTCLAHVGSGLLGGSLELPGQLNAAIGDCVLLAAVADAGPPLLDHPSVRPLADRVFAMFRPDGRICHEPVRVGLLQDHDFLPGAALVAACRYAATGRRGLPLGTLDPQLRWHRGRFRVLRTWGMAGWQPQGWAAAWNVSRNDEQSAFVFEVADWALDHQLEKNGAFLEDFSPEPSFNTGFVAEAIAAAWRVALAVDDERRASAYGTAWLRAMDFLETLVIRPEDTFCFDDPTAALGGVRTSLTRSDVRIDAVSHVLHALVAGLALLS